jgi:hypothetical protein
MKKPLSFLVPLLVLAVFLAACATGSPPSQTAVEDRILALQTGVLATQGDYAALRATGKVSEAELAAWNTYVSGAQTAIPAVTNQWRAVRGGSDAAAKAAVDSQLTALESRYAQLMAVAASKK